MPLNKDDASRISYQAKIDWYAKRTAEVTTGAYTLQDYLASTNDDFEAQNHSAEELMGALDDLVIKCKNLNDKISFLSSGLLIPINPVLDPGISSIVNKLDPSSGGTSLSYALYNTILSQKEASYSSINLDSVTSNLTGNPLADSDAVYSNILNGYSYSNDSSNSGQSTIGNILDLGNVDSNTNQILNFAKTFLANSNDPAYIPWSFRQDIGTEINDATGLSNLWNYFSSNSNASNNIIGGVGDGTPLSIDSTLHDLTTRSITNLNQFLDQTNAVFDFQWATEAICCLTQYCVNLDRKTLQGIRTLLNLMQMSLNFDFSNMLAGIEDAILNIFKNILTNELVNLILQIIQKLTNPIKNWIKSLDPSLFKCIPLNELINLYLNAAILKAEKLLVGIIENFFKQMQLKNIKNGTKTTISGHKKEIGELLKIIDSVIQILEAASRCGINGAPAGDAVSQIAQNYNLDNSNSYVFPTQTNPTIYNSFPLTATVSTTTTPSSNSSGTTSTSSTNSVTGTAVKSNNPCLQSIPADQVSGVQEWIKTINSMSNGSQ